MCGCRIKYNNNKHERIIMKKLEDILFGKAADLITKIVIAIIICYVAIEIIFGIIK